MDIRIYTNGMSSYLYPCIVFLVCFDYRVGGLGVSSYLVLISLILQKGGDLFQIHLAIVLKVNA